jgi:hypothetical protein
MHGYHQVNEIRIAQDTFGKYTVAYRLKAGGVKAEVHCYATSTIRTHTSAVTELKLVRFLRKQIH